MKKRSDKKEDLRKKIMGLGESSFQKSYFPQLKEKIDSLEQSENKFRNYINNSPIGIFVIDLNGNFSLVNKTLQRKFALKPGRISKSNFLDLLDEKNGKVLSKNLQKLKTKSKTTFELSITIKDNPAAMFSIVITKTSGSELLGFVVELTGLRLAQSKMQYYHNRLKLINEITTTTIGKLPLEALAEKMLKKLIDAFEVNAGIIRVFNEEGLVVLTKLNVPEENIVQVLSPYFGIAGEIIKSKVAATIYDARGDDVTKHIQNYHEKAFQFVSYAGAPLLVKHKVIGILGIYTTQNPRHFSDEDLEHLQIAANHVAAAIENKTLFSQVNEQKETLLKEISIRKQTEELLRKSEQEQRLIFKTIPAAIYTCEVPSEIDATWFSESIERITGFQSNFFIEQPNFWTSRLHPEDKDRIIKTVRKNINTGTVETEYRWKLSDGSYRWFKDDLIVTNKLSNGKFLCTGIILDIHERKLGEEALRKSEENYRLIIENQTDLLVKVDKDGKFLLANPAYCQLFGKKESELLGKSFVPLIHPDDREPTQKEMEKLYSPPFTCYVEQRALTVKGWRWLAWNDKAIYNEKHELVEIIGAGRDFTDTKLASEALKASEDKFAKAFKISPDAINLNRFSDGIFIEINEGFSKLTGYTYNEVIGKSYSQINIWEKPEDRQKLIQKLLTEGEVVDLESRFKLKSGATAIGLVSARIIDVNGEKCLLTITRDITERKNAEIELQRNVALHKAIVNSISHGISLVHDNKVFFTSEKLSEILGYSREELLSVNPFELAVIEDRERVIQFHEQEKNSGNYSGSIEFSIVKKDGEIRMIRNRYTRISQPGNFPILMIVTTDITERKNIENALKQSRDKYQNFIEQSTEGIYYLKYARPIDINLPPEKQVELMYETGYIEECNDAMAKMYGYQFRNEFMGMKLATIHGGTSNDENIKSQIGFIKSGYRQDNIETEEIKADGERVYFLNTVVGDIKNGYLLGNWGTQKDITELKTMLKALERSEHKYRNLVESIDEVIFTINNKGLVTYISPSITKIIGIPVDDVINTNFIDYIYPDDRPELLLRFKTLLTGNTAPSEYRLLTKTNEYRWVRSLSHPNMHNGDVSGITGVIIDIHQQKIAEFELEDKIARLQVIQQLYEVYGLSTDPVVLFDGFWSVIPGMYPDKRFNILVYDKDSDSLVNERFYNTGDKSNPANKPLGESVCGLCFKDRKTILINDCSCTDIIPQKNIESLSLKSTLAIPIKSQLEIFGVLRVDDPFNNNSFSDNDVDFFEIVAEQLGVVLQNAELFKMQKKSEDKLKTSLLEKEILLKEIHHRVKNNLQIISSLLNLQSGKLKDKQLVEVFRDSQNRIRTMALIHEKFYQSESLAVVDMKSYTKGLTDYLFRSYNVDISRIKLELNIENVYLSGDFAISCGLIINELLSNSIKYAFNKDDVGIIKISLKNLEENVLELIFEDNGCGVPGNIDLTNTETLGLKLVNLLVRQQSGTLNVTSQNGTRFHIEMKG